MYLMVGPSAMELTPSSWLFPDLLPLRGCTGIQQGCQLVCPVMGPGTIRCLAHSALPMLDEAVRLVRLAVIRANRLSIQPLCAWR